jgi:hypothetical protein
MMAFDAFPAKQAPPYEHIPPGTLVPIITTAVFED